MTTSIISKATPRLDQHPLQLFASSEMVDLFTNMCPMASAGKYSVCPWTTLRDRNSSAQAEPKTQHTEGRTAKQSHQIKSSKKADRLKKTVIGKKAHSDKKLSRANRSSASFKVNDLPEPSTSRRLTLTDTANAIELVQTWQNQLFHRLGFTPQERAVARFVLKGLTYKEIGKKLSLTERSIKNYTKRMFRKAKVGSRKQFEAYTGKAIDQVLDRANKAKAQK